MTNNKAIFKNIDQIVKKVNKFKNTPLFEDEVAERNSRKAPSKITDDQLLRVFATLVAYSNGANSEYVRAKLIDSNSLNVIFKNFSVQKVSKLDPDDLIKKYWKKETGLTYIRMKSKVVKIIEFSKIIKSLGSLSILLTKTHIPKKILNENDINRFWEGFDLLKAKMRENNIPYLKSTTTLLHFLLDAGFDCIKPDSAVMAVAKRIGIVESEKGENNLRMTVKTIQQYSLTRNVRPSIVDLYLLIAKPQKGAIKFVRPEYYSFQS